MEVVRVYGGGFKCVYLRVQLVNVWSTIPFQNDKYTIWVSYIHLDIGGHQNRFNYSFMSYPYITPISILVSNSMTAGIIQKFLCKGTEIEKFV